MHAGIHHENGGQPWATLAHSTSGSMCSKGPSPHFGPRMCATEATPRRRSRKRTYAYVLRRLRFLLTARAGRQTRIGGRHVRRLARNPATGALYVRSHMRSRPELFSDWS